ncbi:MAG: hypothetical protein HC846_10250 [Blastocatellia bacterium]|nr:hypothetical protein [Blastocatellia bacterium]
MTTASFETKAENFEIPITNKPILIEWEQPDDIPLITKALEREEEIFVPEFSSAEPIFIDYQDSVIDTDEANSTISCASEDYQFSRNDAEESPVFSYSNSGVWAKFTENRKVLVGAGIFVLLALGVGGIWLNRQFQMEDEARQTIVQSAPSEKSLPKAAQSEKVLEDNKPLINKPEELPENGFAQFSKLRDYRFARLSTARNGRKRGCSGYNRS